MYLDTQQKLGLYGFAAITAILTVTWAILALPTLSAAAHADPTPLVHAAGTFLAPLSPAREVTGQ